jgi:hypothetical protein
MTPTTPIDDKRDGPGFDPRSWALAVVLEGSKRRSACVDCSEY